VSYLLLEDGSRRLLEHGSFLLLEGVEVVPCGAARTPRQPKRHSATAEVRARTLIRVEGHRIAHASARVRHKTKITVDGRRRPNRKRDDEEVLALLCAILSAPLGWQSPGARLFTRSSTTHGDGFIGRALRSSFMGVSRQPRTRPHEHPSHAIAASLHGDSRCRLWHNAQVSSGGSDGNRSVEVLRVGGA
jgi:hypothetical protein